MRILGIDYGDRRTGIAVSDETEFLASAVCTVKGQDMDYVAGEVEKICKEYKVVRIVLGLPKNMDGSSGFRVKHTLDFKEKLLTLMPDMEIVMYDERMTTMAAAQYMNITDVRGKKRKNSIDALAAQIILQDYLDAKKTI